MITGLIFFLTSKLGLGEALAVKIARITFIAVVIAAVVAAVLIFSQVRSCMKPQPKIDIESIEKINKANERERRDELQKVIANVDEERKLTDDKIREIEDRVEEARKKKPITAEELEKLIEENK
jgi:septal ring factor EnvC (AmiA/AmiB activator)